MYEIRATKSYRKEYKKVARQHGVDLALLDQVIDTLAHGEKLHARHRDHQLSGDLKGFRECHVQNDLLLVYKIEKGIMVLVLVHLGSHSALFKK